MLYEMEHPDRRDLRAVYGSGSGTGFFVAILRDNQILCATAENEHYLTTITNALNLLLDYGFLTAADALSGLFCLIHATPSSHIPGDERRASALIKTLRTALSGARLTGFPGAYYDCFDLRSADPVLRHRAKGKM